MKMSDHIPFEIQVEIMKRLPIKSLIRFTSVSKPWNSLIHSSEFIADYNVHHSHPQHLLVRYRDRVDSDIKYILIDDDDTFPQRKRSLNVPAIIKLISKPEILGSSHGLLCLKGHYQHGVCSSSKPGFSIVVLWNPSIEKSVVIKVPKELGSPYKTIIGFGVCPNSYDPTLVKINCINLWAKRESISCIPLQVEVFTLSSGAWRLSPRNLPRKSICLSCSHIFVDGFIYWIAFDRTIEDESVVFKLIISFDLTSEEFREIRLPYSEQESLGIWSISKLRDSLVLLDCDEIFIKQAYNVWMMEHGDSNSLRKIFIIDAPNIAIDPLLGFRVNGEALLQTINRSKGSATIEVYEPSSKHIKDLGIYGEVDSFFVSPYVETLMLLDQPDAVCYAM